MADHLGAGGGSVAMSTHLRTTFGPRYLAIDVLVGLGPSRAQAAEQPSISIIVVSFQGPLQQHGNPPSASTVMPTASHSSSPSAFKTRTAAEGPGSVVGNSN